METYIVRVWDTERPSVPVDGEPVRGVVRHVRTGRETRFASWAELRRLLAEPAVAGAAHPVRAGRGEDRPG